MKVTIDPKSQEEFGKNLREIREQNKLSQEEVAKAIGISVTYYAGIERGEENPTFAVIRHICKALKVKSSDVLPF
ncbi:XRE family transcriptional regulator [Candidatus Roizmanbacteria bacterium CG_4_10_14_0_2_um_filter_39_13]|uniref:XRE family transcriptional regulator n=1 Tax=Candidatus Roizmanbacteria bacterium CG_4_10_14_0_2_um_filter_39_13 TaxID=1974825 RepID=A0A2M7TZ30_9BACT|nr:MAG: XRE family transcriptional regulator [Candidatus Roizmanbacteria bacterium CG_4_10_14_0_2_um_filter_39_13]